MSEHGFSTQSFSGAGPRPLVEPGAKLGIIGGHGQMGRLFGRFFAERGFRVEAADLDTPRSNEEVAQWADLLLFAVPLHQTVEIIDQVVPHTRPGQLLMDLTSLKYLPVQAMLRSPAAVVGLHPMFGASIGGFEGQTVAACPARVAPVDWAALRGLLISAGMNVKECTPEHHDRMMSIIQVLFHMSTMMMGRVIRELNVDLTEMLDFASPSYRVELDLMGRIFAQDGALYSAISQMNPHTSSIIGLLREALDAYEGWYANADLEGFVEDFSRSSDYLGDFAAHAFSDSSLMLDLVVKRNRRNPRS